MVINGEYRAHTDETELVTAMNGLIRMSNVLNLMHVPENQAGEFTCQSHLKTPLVMGKAAVYDT